jgi:hypothetical protein
MINETTNRYRTPRNSTARKTDVSFAKYERVLDGNLREGKAESAGYCAITLVRMAVENRAYDLMAARKIAFTDARKAAKAELYAV